MNYRQNNLRASEFRFKPPPNRSNSQTIPQKSNENIFNNDSSIVQFMMNPRPPSSVTSSTRRRSNNEITNASETVSFEEPISVVVSITEGRNHARGEVGIAAIDINRPHLIICQLSDNIWYTGTQTKLNMLNPIEIIYPNTFKTSTSECKLLTFIGAMYPNVPQISIPRRHYNDSDAKEKIRILCSPAHENIRLVIDEKYYALCAAGALLSYVDGVKNIKFATKSMKVEYQAKYGTMLIDVETSHRLELVYSLSSSKERHGCLFDVLNYCSTPIGKRTLRAKILEPSCDIRTIENVQNCIKELLEKDELLHRLNMVLKKFYHVDKLLKLSLTISQDDKIKASEMMINRTMQLKAILENIPLLRDILESTESPTFHELHESLNDERFEYLLKKISEVLIIDTGNTKGCNKYFSRLYAVKPKISELLDSTRDIYSNLIEKINRTINSLAERYNITLKMVHNMNWGFHMQACKRQDNFNDADLDECFEIIGRRGDKLFLSTSGLKSMNYDLKDIIEEIQNMSNVIISNLLKELREEIDVIYNLTGAISDLDVLQSLALVSQRPDHCCPKFGDEMRVTNAVHPLLEHCHQKPVPVPNNIIATPEYNFFIVTGPNMGGKTVYLKMVAILQILAQLGCFVPAQYAQFRICDRLFSRLGFNDKPELNASAFVAEMKEIEYIMKNLTANSVLIVDELCRSTDPLSGCTIAWKICEKILSMNGAANDGKYFIDPKEADTNEQEAATTSTQLDNEEINLINVTSPFVWVASHLIELTKLNEKYYNVQNLHFTADETIVDHKLKLNYKYKIECGCTPISGYGMALARQERLPRDVFDRAEQLFEEHNRFASNNGNYDEPSTSKDYQPNKSNITFNTTATSNVNTTLGSSVKITKIERIFYDLYASLATLNRQKNLDKTDINRIVDKCVQDAGGTPIINAIKNRSVDSLIPNLTLDFSSLFSTDENIVSNNFSSTVHTNTNNMFTVQNRGTLDSDLSYHSLKRRIENEVLQPKKIINEPVRVCPNLSDTIVSTMTSYNNDEPKTPPNDVFWKNLLESPPRISTNTPFNLSITPSPQNSTIWSQQSFNEEIDQNFNEYQNTQQFRSIFEFKTQTFPQHSDEGILSLLKHSPQSNNISQELSHINNVYTPSTRQSQPLFGSQRSSLNYSVTYVRRDRNETITNSIPTTNKKPNSLNTKGKSKDDDGNTQSVTDKTVATKFIADILKRKMESSIPLQSKMVSYGMQKVKRSSQQNVSFRPPRPLPSVAKQPKTSTQPVNPLKPSAAVQVSKEMFFENGDDRQQVGNNLNKSLLESGRLDSNSTINNSTSTNRESSKNAEVGNSTYLIAGTSSNTESSGDKITGKQPSSLENSVIGPPRKIQRTKSF